jgi:CelD/BcsL family acetyltransferase involved in cellulose biosynthesis
MHASRSDKDEFLTPAMEAYFRDLAATVPGASIGTLSLDSQPAATLFTFETHNSVLLYNSCYDPGFGHLATGLLSKALAIRDAIERRFEVFDFLRGDEDYKRHLGGSPANLLRITFRDPTA